jgi:hypothetical protein
MGRTARFELSIAIHILDLLQAEVGSLVGGEEGSQKEGRIIVGSDFTFVNYCRRAGLFACSCLCAVSLHVCIYHCLSTILHSLTWYCIGTEQASLCI